MPPLVSILIPAFNAESSIAETIASALAQTWERKEIVIVDDGSTDATLTVARRFASPRINIVSQPHQGAAAARNTAFRLCQGEYLQWLDADDLLAPDKLARQLAAAHCSGSTRLLLSCAWGSFMYRSHRTAFTPTALWCDLSPLEWLLRKLGQNLYMPVQTWLVSRELSEAAGPWDTRLSLDDDGEYFCRVLLASDGTRFVPRARAFYRRTGLASLSRIAHGNGRLDSQCLSMQLHIAHIRSLDDGARVHRACLKYLQRWLIYFHPERPDLVRQLERLAETLGGRLEAPRLPWKYAWIQKAFGWPLAKRASAWMPWLRSSVARSWDRTLFALEGGSGREAHDRP